MAKLKIPRLLVVPIYMAILVAFSVGVWFIARAAGAYNPNGWAFLSGGGILFGVILFVWARQAWWWISGSGDYAGREGLLKRLWNKVFKK